MNHSAYRIRTGILDVIRGTTALTFGLVASIAWAGVNELTPLGPEGGQVFHVGFHRTSADVVYMSGPQGFLRSSDGGSSWQVTARDAVGDIAVDPTDSDRVYAASGDKILVSDDAGLTFSWGYPSGRQGQLFRVACGEDGVVYAPDSAKMYRSDDHGKTWQPVGNFPQADDTVSDVSVDPADAKIVYVSMYGYGVLVSRDAGVTWQSLTAAPAILHTVDVEVDRSNPLRLWAATITGVYRSDNGGVDWSRTFEEFSDRVEIDPVDSQLVYAASGSTIVRTTDGGATWNTLPQNFGNSAGAAGIAIHPTVPGRLVAYSDGIWLSSDGGAHWLRGNTGLIGTFVNSIVPAIGTSGFYLAAGPSGIYRLDSDGNIRAVDNERLRALQNPSLLWVGNLIVTRVGATGSLDTLISLLSTRLIARSVDGGTQWTSVALPSSTAIPTSLVMSSGGAATLYLGTTEGVFSSMNLGDTWAPRNVGLPTNSGIGLLSTSDPQVLYAVVSSYGGDGRDSRLFKTTDAGQSWAVTAAPAGVRLLKAHPSDPQTVYGTDQQNLLRTTNGGATWTALNDDIDRDSYNDVTFDPRDANVMYAASGAWVLRSIDGGATWERVVSTTDSYSTSIVANPFAGHSMLVGGQKLGLRELSIQPDLQLFMSGPTRMTAGTAGTFTLDLKNAGPTLARNVRVTAQLPAGATNITTSTAAGSCSVIGQEVACTIANFSADGTASITLNATTANVGDFIVQASVTATEADVNTANNSMTVQSTVNASSSSGSGGGGSFSLLLLALAGLRVVTHGRGSRTV